MKPRSQPRRISDKKLKSLGGKMPFTTVTAKPKPLKRSNPKRQAKRKIGYRKMLSGKEYKAARAEAFKRAEDRCEFVRPADIVFDAMRCLVTEGLHAHHLRYPKSRALEASDLQIVCKAHHEYLESQKMGKTRMF